MTHPRQHRSRPATLRAEQLEDRLAPAGLIVQGSPPGAPAALAVYAADTGGLERTLTPFAPGFTGGLVVAGGDVTGDGRADVVAAAGPGGGPVVRGFDGKTLAPVAGPLGGFFAFDPSFRGGATAAVADVTRDGRADVVVGAGPGGGPHVKVFDGKTGALTRSLFAFDPGFAGGVEVAAGDLDGDGAADIVAGAGPGGGPRVTVFSGADGTVLSDFFAFDPSFRGGARVAVRDADGDGRPDLVVGAGPGGAPHVKTFDGRTGAILSSAYAGDPASAAGAEVDAPGVYLPPPTLGGGRPTPGPVPPVDTTTVLLRDAGLGTYFEGEAAGLPPTNQTPPPDTSYERPFTPVPNVTAAFRARGLPVQTTDWWSPVANRTTNNPTLPNGWPAGSNNNPVALVADPVVYGLRPDQKNDVTKLQFGVGRNADPRTDVVGHYLYGNQGAPGDGLVNSATRVFGRFTPFEGNGLLDLQVGVFDPAVPAGPDNAGDGTNAPAQRAVPVTNIAVDDYSDWGATFAWTDPTGAFGMTATGMVGSPYTYFTTSGGRSVELYFGRVIPSLKTDEPISQEKLIQPTRVLSNTGGVLVLAAPQLDGQRFLGRPAYYAVFGPAGSSWNVLTRTSTDGSLTYSAKAESDLGGKDYFAVAALPAGAVTGQPGSERVDPAVLELFRSHAYAFPTNPTPDPAVGPVGSTQVVPAYDPTTGTLTTQYRVYTALKEAGAAGSPNVNAPLFTLYPHQYKNLDASSAAALAASPDLTYLSPKGSLKLYVPAAGTGGGFATELRYRGGLLPVLPGGITDPADNDILLKYLARMAATPYDQVPVDPATKASGAGNFNSLGGAYEAGKRMLRVANVLPLFDLAAPTAQYPAAAITAMRNVLLGQVKRHLADWFDATDYKFFLRDTTWDTVLPYPDDGFRAIQTNNDHHFHYGYFLKAAALVARYDPAFVSDAGFGPILALLAKDVANTDRADARFPFLRNFQPFLGHSYADGVGADDQGNNQESSSEAMNFASGLVMLGEAMMAAGAAGGRELRDAGVYLYTTEEASVGEYWFDVGQTNHPADFTDTYDVTTLTEQIDASRTTITVQTTSTATNPQPIRLPAVTPFTVQVDGELMLVTATVPGQPLTLGNGATVGTATWTVSRGAFGTTPAPHWLQNTFNNDPDPTKNPFLTRPWVKKVAVKSAPFRATTVTTALDDAATQLTVASADQFPSSNGFLASVGNEVVTVTAGAGTTTWTIQRGREGTAAVGHGAGEPVRLVSPTRITAATIIQAGAVSRSNFFAGDNVDEPATNFAISWLPVGASSLYLGRYRTADGRLYAREGFGSMLNMESFLFSDAPVYAAGPYKYLVNGTLKGTPGQGGEYPGSVWAYQALSDPAGALAALHRYVLDPAEPDLMRTQGSPGGFDGLDTGESVALTFAFAHSLARLSEVDPDVYATAADPAGLVATTAAFRDPASGARTYVAYNPFRTAQTVVFHNADQTTVSVTVQPGEMASRTATGPTTPAVELAAPQNLPDDTPPANRLFLRGEYAAVGGNPLTTYLSREPGDSALAVVLPVASDTADIGNPRGPDFLSYFGGGAGFTSPMQFEIAGISGTPLPNAGVSGGPRTAFSMSVLNNLFRNPTSTSADGTRSINENSALVVLNVAYFASAADAKPARVEVWSLGPQGYDGNGALQPGFGTGRATWQPYFSESWFTRDPNQEPNWFLGNYPTMADGRVRVSVWTVNPNTDADGNTDLPQSRIGLRANAAAGQGRQAYLDIPYSGITS